MLSILHFQFRTADDISYITLKFSRGLLQRKPLPVNLDVPARCLEANGCTSNRTPSNSRFSTHCTHSDRKTAQNYALVHRSQDDPLINDASASSMVFASVPGPNTHKNKNKTRTDLEAELGITEHPDAIRENEGEAANYGVYYDDTSYDYMQHLRDLGEGSGDAYFVSAEEFKKGKDKANGKGKMKLEDALREAAENEDGVSEAGGVSIAGSSAASLAEERQPLSKKKNYQAQQDIPDALAGFQPDMDPRLREVLEALEDEAYVDDEQDEQDFFGELAKDGEEVNADEWEDYIPEDEDNEGWDSDATEKPSSPHTSKPTALDLQELAAAIPSADDSSAPLPAPGSEAQTQADGDWLAEFAKFKRAEKADKVTAAGRKAPAAPSAADLQSSLFSTSTAGGRKKKRKGALTSTSGYSMTSSSLLRTEGQTLLDSRFDKIEEMYNEDEDMEGMDEEGQFDDASSVAPSLVSVKSGASRASNYSRASTAASSGPGGPVRSDFDSIMDEFLGGYSVTTGKKKRVRKGNQTGMEQLDEVRQGLGPARFKSGGGKRGGKASVV